MNITLILICLQIGALASQAALRNKEPVVSDVMFGMVIMMGAAAILTAAVTFLTGL